MFLALFGIFLFNIDLRIRMVLRFSRTIAAILELAQFSSLFRGQILTFFFLAYTICPVV